ncbi:hypothetical protein [Trichoplusia ni ascovirus 2c]|uniref:hypothetical protein n=1 Tax=Trichoplusia ni ascovirus 2c TaxID=328615 RepID=UPI0000E44234|nr:hypothetical protein TNAV2c_gp092 [Trichoplusia ni ascovirus 2c]ABF70609.1 hypothetical protein [Trichoplusia ni ascovirus 2c]AUS94198.1 hypothetical protein [Trichoplusia ni ascovirus 6b]
MIMEAFSYNHHTRYCSNVEDISQSVMDTVCEEYFTERVAKKTYSLITKNVLLLDWCVIKNNLTTRLINHAEFADRVENIKYSLSAGVINWMHRIPSTSALTDIPIDNIRKRLHGLVELHPDLVDWNYISKNCHQRDISIWQHRLDWYAVSKFNSLSDNIIIKYANRLDWRAVCRYQNLTVNTVSQCEHLMKWNDYSWNISPNVEVLLVYKNKINWNILSQSPYCVTDVLLQFSSVINWWFVSKRMIVTPDEEILRIIQHLGYNSELTHALIENSECMETLVNAQNFLRRYSNFINPKILIRYMMSNTDSGLFNTNHGCDYYRKWYKIVKINSTKDDEADISSSRVYNKKYIKCTIEVNDKCFDTVVKLIESVKKIYDSTIPKRCCNGGELRKCFEFNRSYGVVSVENNPNSVWHTGICVICMDETKSVNVTFDQCQHAVACLNCVENMLKSSSPYANTCPYCRKKFNKITIT